MKLTSIIQVSLLTAIAIHCNIAFSANISRHTSGQQVTAQSTATNKIQAFEKNFSFDWNNHATIAPNKIKIEKTEAFIKSIGDYTNYTNLSYSNRKSLGTLLYKLGTYYTHVSHEPELAIEKMKLADMLLITKTEKAWNNNHLAYAYEQKYATTGRSADKENALEYINVVLTELYPNTMNKEVAFAYCVKGLLFHDAKDYARAEENYKIALNMYEQLPDGKDEQYARTKNRLASIMLEQNNHDPKALAMLEEVKKYWTAKGNIDQNPYAAKNLMTIGQAHLDMGSSKMACAELNKAIRIYKNVYGNDDTVLATPYQLLAEAYKERSNIKLASLYQEKANQLSA